MKGWKHIWLSLASGLALLVSCEPRDPFVPEQDRSVCILYSCGYNNLSGNLAKDIRTLSANAPEGRLASRYKFLVFSHQPAYYGSYTIPNSPVLIDVYKNRSGEVVMDTVKVYPASMPGSSADAVSRVLTDIGSLYPAKEYGMVMSSHGTGWLPTGYYNTSGGSGALFSASQASLRMCAPPLVKSMCSQFGNDHGQVTSDYEIEIDDFAAAVPFHLKYLVLDMCLMGGVECAYELRNVADFLAVSPTEVLADGMEYEHMLDRLLYSGEPDVRGVCEDYYNHYAEKNSSATISLIDCRQMNGLASVCADIFEKYRNGIRNVNQSNVQRYWRDGKHWFYDLRDILVDAGVSAEDMAAFDKALASCVLYNEATPKFLEITIRTHCGLSMYLPKMDSNAGLRAFYSGLAWNKATSLVK